MAYICIYWVVIARYGHYLHFMVTTAAHWILLAYNEWTVLSHNERYLHVMDSTCML